MRKQRSGGAASLYRAFRISFDRHDRKHDLVFDWNYGWKMCGEHMKNRKKGSKGKIKNEK